MSIAKYPRLLGIAASLRNARWGIGHQQLIDSLERIPTEKDLMKFLSAESDLHLDNFLKAGRREGKSFMEIYKNLKSNKGNKGLSNSETALAAALWAANKRNVAIDHLSLAEYFPASGVIEKEGELKEKLQSADGIMISSPVYFGDRSSLVQELINMIRKDHGLQKHLKNKIYSGISVGAKRNGGQETTLIYQLLDALSIGMLGVGNDGETTAQYGGTGHAGDVGTMHRDDYGLQTSMGTGRRVANLIRMLSHKRELEGPLRIAFLILQDSKGLAMRGLEDLIAACGNQLSPTIIDISSKHIMRCIACDICPTDIDIDEEYRCVIKSKNNDIGSLHRNLLDYDAIVPIVASVKDSNTIKTNYQTFIERTRYLRRGDYVFSNVLVAPLIFEEVGANEYYSARMVTSMIRHHTVIAKPIIGYINDGILLNKKELDLEFNEFVAATRRLAAARLAELDATGTVQYHPVGYILSANKDIEDERLKKRAVIVKHRDNRMRSEAKIRLKPKEHKKAT